MKNLRNNWITEKCQEIRYTLPDNISVVGRFKDVIDLYRSESTHVVKRTKLSYQSCFPSLFERQNVSLVLRIFNEKTVSALAVDGKKETAMFIKHFLRLWNMLNIKYTDGHVLLNDPDRKPFSSVDDARFSFISKTADNIASMPGDVGNKRIKSLTSVTRDSFANTLRAFVELWKELLEDKGWRYILPGIFQTDPLENEFGCY